MSNKQNWKILYENIKKMRETIKAPVDTMGCFKCADMSADPKVNA